VFVHRWDRLRDMSWFAAPFEIAAGLWLGVEEFRAWRDRVSAPA
jgi:hypothetical protein